MLNWMLKLVERRRKKKRVRKIESVLGKCSEDLDELIRRLSEL